MQNWTIFPAKAEFRSFSSQNHDFVVIDGFMQDPDVAREDAVLQKFAKITPQYPGIRAPLPSEVARKWLSLLAPMLSKAFKIDAKRWGVQIWYSLVTAAPDELLPIQRLPHVDGTDPDLVAMMLYLDHTEHGGTAFFRHRSTGFEALTEQTFPTYRTALERDVKQSGLPPMAYITDGAPHFERIHASEGAFNQAVFYRGNVLHSGIIDNRADLSPDPRKGRLTINGLFRPI